MRRTFNTLISGFLALMITLPGLSYGADVKEVAEGVYAFIGENGATNSGFVVTSEGVVVIDTQGPKEAVMELKEKIRKTAGDKPVIHAVNTHYHGDHTFGNQYFTDSLGGIIAHEKTREALITRDSAHRKRFKRFFGEDSLIGFNFTPPDITFTGRLTLSGGGRTIELVYTGPAHTDGDVYVYLPAEKVVFTGDLLYKKRLPWLADGVVQGAIRACDELLALDAGVYVPGHGGVATRKDVVEYKRYLETLTKEVKSLIDKGRTLKEIKQKISLPDYSEYGKYGEWLPLNAEKVYNELTGTGD